MFCAFHTENRKKNSKQNKTKQKSLNFGFDKHNVLLHFLFCFTSIFAYLSFGCHSISWSLENCMTSQDLADPSDLNGMQICMHGCVGWLLNPFNGPSVNFNALLFSYEILNQSII